MATQAQRRELQDKVSTLVTGQFGGDYRRVFRHYDRNQDGKINKPELVALLKDAGVGNLLTRGAWADGIIGELDSDGDGTVSEAEFESVWR
jgi:Ca2+-binding EF-hand superfamily protein